MASGKDSILIPLLTRGPAGCDALRRGCPTFIVLILGVDIPTDLRGQQKKPTVHQLLNPEQKP